MAMAQPAAGFGGPDQDPDKLMLNEAENLEVIEHDYILNGIEERLLESLG
jgi:ER membrane protein complex subunit 3